MSQVLRIVSEVQERRCGIQGKEPRQARSAARVSGACAQRRCRL